MKRIFVVYRENDLYEKIVPKISEWLKDYEISIIAFPSSANKDELGMGINMHLGMFRDNIVISDATCSQIIIREDEKANPTKFTKGSFRGEKENPIQFTNTLDSLCNKAIRSACGAMFEEGYSNIRNENADGAKIIYNLLEKIKTRGTIPKKIYVVTECTGDHAPFCYWDNGIDDNKNDRRKYEADIVAPIIKQWFEKKFKNKVEIISALSAFSTEEYTNLHLLKKIDLRGTWVIMDRHFAAKMKHQGAEYRKVFLKATVLKLPLSDFFEDVYENKLLEFDDELLANEECLKKLIEKGIEKRIED